MTPSQTPTTDAAAGPDTAPSASSLLDALLQAPVPAMAGARAATPLAGAAATGTANVVGRILAFSQGHPLVAYDGQPGAAALVARTVVDMDERSVGRDVLLTFDRGLPDRPIVVGVLRDAAAQTAELLRPSEHVSIDADGTRIVVQAGERLELRCGHASITMTRDGKLVLEARSITSRAMGVHRIAGGSVQIN